MASSVPKRPVEQLRDIAAPRDLIEWVRKLPPEGAARRAWVDAPRADWVPYLAVLRGITADAILRAACECAVETAEATRIHASAEGARVVAVLRACAERGRDALATTEADFQDLRLAMIDPGATSAAGAAWMFWAKLALELARGAGRGNRLIGIALALRMLASARPGARVSHLDVVARLRDKLTLAG